MKAGRRLFHVVNTALNVVASTNLAWQERKAETFVMTPLACGNPFVGFVPTRFYGALQDGVALGTAMAISGAAVSPNQGYHSSPIVGLLMMLFNVRLGWWLGNPQAGPRFYRREGTVSQHPCRCSRNWPGKRQTPDTTSIFPTADISTISACTRWFDGAVILSWSAMPELIGGTFEDLGNAVRKIWIDLGIRIEFDRIDVGATAEAAG